MGSSLHTPYADVECFDSYVRKPIRDLMGNAGEIGRAGSRARLGASPPRREVGVPTRHILHNASGRYYGLFFADIGWSGSDWESETFCAREGD